MLGEAHWRGISKIVQPTGQPALPLHMQTMYWGIRMPERLTAKSPQESHGELGGANAKIATIDLQLDRPRDPATRFETVQEIRRACGTNSFFVATGHGVPPETIAAILNASSRFFQQPLECKRNHRFEPRDPLQRGFTHADVDKFSFSNLGDMAPSGGESAEMSLLHIPNKWPSFPPEFREVCLAYWSAVEALAAEVVQLLALALGLSENWFDDKVNNHMTRLAINHYPPKTSKVSDREFRNDPHQDWGMLTLLHQGTSYGGLQVLEESGRWLNIPSDPNTFVVQLGDLMARWTNDVWGSTLHRVEQPPQEHERSDRISLAFFYQPNHDAVIECIPTCKSESTPPHYPPITSYDYLAANRRRAAILSRIGRAKKGGQ